MCASANSNWPTCSFEDGNVRFAFVEICKLGIVQLSRTYMASTIRTQKHGEQSLWRARLYNCACHRSRLDVKLWEAANSRIEAFPGESVVIVADDLAKSIASS